MDSGDPLKIILVAEEAAGVQALRALARSEHRIIAVMTAAVDEPGRPSAVKDVAAQLGYATWPARWVKDAAFAERMLEDEADLLLNVHSLYLINERVLAAPSVGSYNMHPGPLPRYAGLNVVSWALYYGETRHAVTVHRMAPTVDAGPIAYEAWFDLDDEDTALTVSAKCVRAGIPLIEKLLKTVAADLTAIPAIPQDPSQRRYFGKNVPDGGELLWSRPARRVVNFVRACDYLPFRSPWGHPRVRLEGRELAIVKAKPLDEAATAPAGTVGDPVGRAVKVAAADRWVLVHRLLCDGQPQDGAAQLRPGQRFEEPVSVAC